MKPEAATPEVRRVRRYGSSSPKALLESAALTLALPCIGWLIDRSDPLMLHRPFSWLLIAPLLIGIRHGLALGCASAIALDGLLVFAWRAHALGVESLPGETVVGLLALSMVAGQYSNVWTRAIGTLEARAETLQLRLTALTRAHVALEVSHDRLRDERPEDVSLRDALQALRDAASQERGSDTLEQRMMALLVRYCGLEVASLHRAGAGGRFTPEPIAVIGRPAPIDPNDPLLQRALETRLLVHVAELSQTHAAGSTLLAAVPIGEASGTLRAVLCVQSMPFMAFHRKNLQIISALGCHWADLTAAPGHGARAERETFDAHRSSPPRESDVPS
jgi:polysaccharide biosynthesis protein PelD